MNRYLQFSYASSECVLNWNVIIYDVQNSVYSIHGVPCPARDLFPWLNTRVKVHISVLTINEYPKRHHSYLSDSGDTSYHCYWSRQKEAHYSWFSFFQETFDFLPLWVLIVKLYQAFGYFLYRNGMKLQITTQKTNYTCLNNLLIESFSLQQTLYTPEIRNNGNKT